MADQETKPKVDAAGYAEFAESAGSAEETAQTVLAVQRLVGELRRADQQVEECEQALKDAQKWRRDLAERQMPELFEQLGVTELKMSDGLKVLVKEKIRASIPQKHREEAMAWLEEHGHAALIKRTLVAAFNRDQQESAAQAMEVLTKMFRNVKQDRKVEPSTLRSWVKQQLEAGEELPLDLFGVFRQNEAQVVLPQEE